MRRATRGRTASDLTERGLIKIDLAGGISLLPFIRELVHDALSPERRKHLHRGAAHLRAQRGDYTAAAWHYLQADHPDTAVEIWFPHQDGEIMAGQAAAADEVFSRIEPKKLDKERRAQYIIIRNRLALLAGEADRVLEGMEGFRWDADDEISADALGQWAYALEMRDQTDQALAKYDEAIEILSRAALKITGHHLRRGFAFLGVVDPQAANNEVLLASCDLERLQGMIDLQAGRLDSALNHFQTSLRFAETAGDKLRIARANFVMSNASGMQGRIDDARNYAEAAMAFYAEIGDRVQLEGIRAELAGLYLNVRQFDAVIEPSEKALQYFERIKHEDWIAHISSNLAEAYMETGRLEEAKAMAFKVLRMEIAPDRPYALYTLGHIHDRQGNPSHAVTSFTEGIEVAQANGDPFIEAYLQRALGALLVRTDQLSRGMSHLDNSLKLFADIGLEHEVTATMKIRQEIVQANPDVTD